VRGNTLADNKIIAEQFWCAPHLRQRKIPAQFPANFLHPRLEAMKPNKHAGFREISAASAVNSLLHNELCGFWAEFEAFATEFEKVPAIFPVFSFGFAIPTDQMISRRLHEAIYERNAVLSRLRD
jgi:hypothetical protein